MPIDHLSDEWWDKFIESNLRLVVYKSQYWIGVHNLKFLNGMPDEKYNYVIDEHITFFSVEPQESLKKLSFEAQINKLGIEDEMHEDGYYTYFNSPITMSIKRLHWHAIKWKTDNHNSPIML